MVQAATPVKKFMQRGRVPSRFHQFDCWITLITAIQKGDSRFLRGIMNDFAINGRLMNEQNPAPASRLTRLRNLRDGSLPVSRSPGSAIRFLL